MSTETTLAHHGIILPAERIADFCRRWKLRELAVFGSILRDDFSEQSDIDLLYDPRPGTSFTLDDLLAMDQELETMLGRKVDLVERGAVERSRNYLRRRHILASAETIYVEG
jgi:predicted nucleotidyltransferase